MSDATLWIDEAGCTVLVKNGSAIHILPLWVFEDMRDIILAEAKKEVEVTHRDFDIQQELLDRYRAENAKLQASNEVIAEDHAALCEQNAKLRELLAKAGELIVIAGWPDVECDKMASAVMHGIRELGVD